MTQQELIWAKLALLADLRQAYGDHHMTFIDSGKGILGETACATYHEIVESLWSDLKNAKVEEPIAEEHRRATEIMPGCCPEPLEGDSKR